MRPKHLLFALLGFPGIALAASKDAELTDETYIRRQFELSQERSREILRIREAKRKEFLDQSSIGGAEDSCLAYAVETGNCSISAAEFDRFLASHIPDSLELQSGESLAFKASRARKSVFEQLLDRAFLADYQPEDSLGVPESEAGEIRADRGFFAGYDLPTLLKAFPLVRARVVAASDSAWLASRVEDPRSGILPITIPAWELPDSAAALLSGFPAGEWTPIRRVPFGFLTCSWLDTLPAPEMLAKIRPRLDQSGSKSGVERRSLAIEAPRKQGERCWDEDTLSLSLRLEPPLRRQAREPGPSWLTAHSAVLPASVKSWLLPKFKQGTRDTLGPLRSAYGIWMLAPSSPDIRPGRMLDSTACRARAEAKMRKENDAERIRSEWERMTSKLKSDHKGGDVRTTLLEQLSKQGDQPEYLYHRMRERWVSGSLRFTRDMGFLDASPETGDNKTE